MQLLFRADLHGLSMRWVLSVNTRKLTFGAMMLAVTIVFLALTAVLPTLDLTLCAAASVCVALTVTRCGLGYGVMSFAAASLMAFLLLPDKTAAVFFALAFGPYPLYRRLAGHIRQIWLQWVVKLVLANALVLLAFGFFRWAFSDIEGPLWQMAGLLLLYNIVVVLYDKASGRVEEYLGRRFAKHKD